MQFELTMSWNFIQAYRDVGIDFTPYRAFTTQYDYHQDQLPKLVVCHCSLRGDPQPIRMTVFTTMPWARIQFDVDDAALGKEIRQKLLPYSTEDKNGTIYKAWNTRQITNRILARHGLTMNGIQRREGTMSPQCIEELMRHYDETESMFRRDISWLFNRDVVPKAEQPMVAKWLVVHLARKRNWSDGSHIIEQLYNELAVPEIADDLIRILTDRSSPVRDGCLFDVFVKTKDRRVLEVAVSVLDDNELTQRALATIGRRKAKQHVEKVREFLDHPNSEIRKEAKRAMKQLGFPVETPPPPIHLVKKGGIPKKMGEWSANLDAEDVNPILEKLAKQVESGFGAKEIAEVNGALEDMKEEQTKAFRFPIVAEGKKTDLWLVIFMDDVDSPDLEIHSSPELIQKLDKLLSAEK